MPDEKFCLDDAKPTKIIEETSVETMMPVIKEEKGGDDDDDVLLSASNESNHVNLRRFSTGALDKRGLVKAQVQTRYRGNQLSSTHDLCKHGKRREENVDLVIKPRKLVKRKNVESGDLRKIESLDVLRKSLGNVTKHEKPLKVAAKKDVVSEFVESCDGLRVKRNETKSTNTTPKDSDVVRKVKKTNLDVTKVSRISENKSSKEDVLKNLKNKKKKSLNLSPSMSSPSMEVKESRVTGSDPKQIRQTTSMSKTSLFEKKKIGAANLVTDSKTESKIQPKRIGLKVTPPLPPTPPTNTEKQETFKKGKDLEPKPEDSALKMIKYKKKIVQEPKVRSDGNNKKKKNLKDKREGVGKMNNGEAKREKVVLKHRKVEAKKKQQTLFNNVIEETVNKLGEVKKVKALVGAFETVISLQDNDRTYTKKKKIQSKSTSSQVVES